MKRKSIALVAAVAALSLPACGGEVDDDVPDVTDDLTETTVTLPDTGDATTAPDMSDDTDTTGLTDTTDTTGMDDTSSTTG